nr:hypothetical protein Hi04_10k_c4921_00013 [uncultured bacterium]
MVWTQRQAIPQASFVSGLSGQPCTVLLECGWGKFAGFARPEPNPQAIGVIANRHNQNREQTGEGEVHNMSVVGWGLRAVTENLLRQDCAGLARSLEAVFSSRKAKSTAAIILRNIATEAPVCQFCGGGPHDVNCLVESPFNPTVLICDWCARRAVSHAERLKRTADEADPPVMQRDD